MCLFTHFAAGALAGGLTGNAWAAVATGLASHAVLDMIPHYDHPDWRLELTGGLLALLVLALLPFASWPAVIGGLAGMAPDLENLLQKLGHMGRDRFVFPTHTGLLRHGRTLGPRSLVWQVAIFCGCFALLGLLAPAPAAAQEAASRDAAVMARPQVRVLSRGIDRTVLRIDCPVDVAPDDWRAVDAAAVRYALPPGLSLPTDGSAPQVVPPLLDVVLAVPTRATPRVTVGDVSWWRAPAAGERPAGLVSVGTPAVSREVPLTAAHVALGVADGVLAGLTVTIDHPAEPRYRERLDAAKAAGPEVGREAFATPAEVRNPDLYAQLAAGGRLALAEQARTVKAAPAVDPFALTSNWIRLRVDATGIHRLTGQDLSGFGLGTSAVDPAKLRLYRGGSVHLAEDPAVTDAAQPRAVGLNEVAIEVRDGGDGEWNLDDEIRFYGVATSAWLDRLEPGAPRLEHYDHPYADEAVYWLTWASEATASPLPGAPLRVAVDAAPLTGGQQVATARRRIHEERQFLDMPGVFADNWGWGTNITSTREESFVLADPVADSLATFVVDVRGRYDSYSLYLFTVRAWLNQDTGAAGSVTFGRNAQNDSLRLRVGGASAQVVDGANTITLENASPEPRQGLILDSFDILYWADLRLPADGGQLDFAHWGDQVASPGTVVDLRVGKPAGAAVAVWDVTDPYAPRLVTGVAAADEIAWGAVRDPGESRHYQVAPEAGLLAVAGGLRTSPTALFTRSTAYDYIVVCADAFGAAGEDLADYRSTDLPGVASPAAVSVAVSSIYDNFSGGQKDPLAIRNFLRHVYTGSAGRLKYACFLGNASRDYRNYRDRTPLVDLYDLVPTALQVSFPTYPINEQRPMPYASDHALVSFDTAPPSVLDYPDRDDPDLACGRLPALNPQEARAMVDRVIAFAGDPAEGPWSNRVLFTADDVYRPRTGTTTPLFSESVHTEEAEEITWNLLPIGVDVVKLYGVEYPFPPASQVKPAMRAEINAALNAGTTIFYYVGHGAEDNLADEQVFQSRDIANLSNGMRRPVFVAFSCDVGVYDSPTRRSMAEQFIQYDAGGAIGAVCASQVSWSVYNDLVAEAFFAELYPGQAKDAGRSVGEALRLALGDMSDTASRVNAQRYNLMGDPALAMPHPPDDLAFAPTSLDTIRAGARQAVVLAADAPGQFLAPGDAYQLRVEEAARSRTYPVTVSGLTRTYRKSGATVFAGNGAVGDGDLIIPFKVPAQISYGESGRVRLLLDTAAGERIAVSSVPAVRSSLGEVTDADGPLVRLATADGGTSVQPGGTLRATLTDTSGIAIQGTGPGNSLLLEFDNTGFTTDVTPSFAYDPQSYTTGAVTMVLPQDLAFGRHTAALYARDTLGNVGADTLSFTIGQPQAEGVRNMALFPNPTPGDCRLVVELSSPMSVRWDIYSLAGRRVRSVLPPGPPEASYVLAWDGKDERGDEIANGTYLYVLRCTPAVDAGRDFTTTGKLVIMR